METVNDIDASSATRVEITVGLHLTVYATKDRAKAAQRQAGGIVLEVDAASLAEIENEYEKDVLLIEDASNEGSQPSKACLSLCFDGLPFTYVPNYGPHEPGTVPPQGHIAHFGEEAQAWLDEFEKLTGFELHQ